MVVDLMKVDPVCTHHLGVGGGAGPYFAIISVESIV